MSLCRKRQLLRRLAELPRQQVTSPYSCMILIISHMAEGAETGGQESGGGSPMWGAGQRPTGQNRRQREMGLSLGSSCPQFREHRINIVTSDSLEWATHPRLPPGPAEQPRPRDSLSGVQSVKRGTSRGTLSMFCRWGRTWWMPRGSLAWREQAPVASGSLLAPSSALDQPRTVPHSPGLWGHRPRRPYPVAVLQEAGEVAVCGLEANEV